MKASVDNDPNRIIIGLPIRKGCRYEIPFEIPNSLQRYFADTSFWFECSDSIDIPDSIAIIPAVANIIPFSWVFKCELVIPTLDESFYRAIPKIKRGYIDMLPNLHLGGSLKVEDIVCNISNSASGKPLLLFSGGVDAWCSLVRHIGEKPHLVSVWGSDISTGNVAGWGVVNEYSKAVASSLGLLYSHVKSNLREMINYRALDDSKEMMTAGYRWWHDLQHGIGLLSLTAPLSYATDAPIAYIASSNTAKDKGRYVCASDPTIDNNYSVGLLHAIHDGYELTRQDKVDAIVNYAQENNISFQLRVCYHVESGGNCCQCEKCARTILEIIAAGGQPTRFGFDCSPLKFNLLMWRMKNFFLLTYPFYYHDIAYAVRSRNIKLPKSANWVLSGNLDAICDNGFKRAWKRFHNFGASLYHELIGR